MKKKFKLEYQIKAPVRILFERLSTAAGLMEWFADSVDERDGLFTFVWSKQPSYARRLHIRDNQLIRFQWVDHDDFDDTHYFEFHITQDALTQDVFLTVTDFADDDELSSSKDLWDSQIQVLRRLLGADR